MYLLATEDHAIQTRRKKTQIINIIIINYYTVPSVNTETKKQYQFLSRICATSFFYKSIDTTNKYTIYDTYKLNMR